MSINSSNKEQRKPFLALIGEGSASASIHGLMLLAAASFALISSITPMTVALAQELANNNNNWTSSDLGRLMDDQWVFLWNNAFQ